MTEREIRKEVEKILFSLDEKEWTLIFHAIKKAVPKAKLEYKDSKADSGSQKFIFENLDEDPDHVMIPSDFIPALMDHLDKRIVGQEDAKRAIVGALYLYIKYDIRQPILFVGNTGCGKTYLIKTAVEWADTYCGYVHFASKNVSYLTAEGWSGDNYSVSLRLFDGVLLEGHKYIVLFDEFDKIMQPSHNSNSEDYNAQICGQIMNIISGEDRHLANIDWSRILVLGAGSFEWAESERKKVVLENRQQIGFGTCGKNTLYTERQLLERAGVIKEILGRFAYICHLDKLTEKDILRILTISAEDGGFLNQTIDLFNKEGIKIVFSSKACERIAARAAADDHGARSIQSILYDLLGPDRLVDLKLRGETEFHITGEEGEDKHYIDCRQR